MRIAVTGANGFVGTALCQHLAEHHHDVRALVRAADHINGPQSHTLDTNSKTQPVNYDDEAGLLTALSGCDTLIHLIARTHTQDSTDALAHYRQINVDLSARLATVAAKAGVRRLVYLSSIKALGESTSGTPFSANSSPQPTTPYGISKREAESCLQSICDNTGMELTIVRPPLIYAPHAKGNIHTLRRAIELGLPLPFASIRNRRSAVTLPHLCELLRLCCGLPQLANLTLLTSDCPQLSTAQLARQIAADTGRAARLLPCPPALLRLAAKLTGNTEAMDRLLGDLEVDDRRTRTLIADHQTTQDPAC